MFILTIHLCSDRGEWGWWAHWPHSTGEKTEARGGSNHSLDGRAEICQMPDTLRLFLLLYSNISFFI